MSDDVVDHHDCQGGWQRNRQAPPDGRAQRRRMAGAVGRSRGSIGGGAADRFSREMVAAAFAGERPTPGYAIEIADARVEGDALVIPISEQPPARGGVAAQVIVSPFHMVRMPRHNGEDTVR